MNTHLTSSKIWLFDVDKTLYPPNNGLFQEGNKRINRYLEKHLQLDPSAVNSLRKEYMEKYGTSLLGSIKEKGLDGNDFLHYVHSFPLNQYLTPQPLLLSFLDNLPGKKYIFSNAPQKYISEILSIVGVQSVFTKIYGIQSFRFHGKPHVSSYKRILHWIGAKPQHCILVDDMKINCDIAIQLGLQAIWIDENQRYNDYYTEILIPCLAQFLSTQEWELH
ncbi:MAG: HAD-IA family hydrolase [Caldisericia bacterium]|nr:HAD-IA family hydrolase [Caldisericia bacterium]MDD4614680.1 HAD-IA family hydrolase [Caldisericia bacterium]